MNSEYSVIGSMLCSREAVIKCLGILEGSYFTDEGLGKIFDVIKSLHKSGAPIDQVTVAEKAGPGFVPLLSKTIDLVPSAVNAEYYAYLIRKAHLEKELSNICRLVALNPGDPDIRAKVYECLINLEEVGRKIMDFKALWGEYEPQINERAIGNDLKIKSGISSFDDMTEGFKRGQLVVIGGRTNSGKSSACIRLSLNAIKQNLRVLYVSGEITSIDIMDKLISLESGKPMRDIESAKIKNIMGDVTNAVARISDRPFYFMSPRKLSLEIIEAAIDQIRPDLVFVDYIQMFIPENARENRAAFYSDIAHGMKNLAINKKILVILASQFSRKTDERGPEEEPTLADFKESGGIEQAAHMAILLHPKYHEEVENSNMIPIDWIVAKNKGPHAKVSLMFDKLTTDFKEWAFKDDHDQSPT